MSSVLATSVCDLKSLGNILLILLNFILFISQSSSQSDPGVGSLAILDLNDNPVAASELKKNGTYKIRLQVGNYSSNTLHAGCAEVRIGLGSLFQLEENFNLSSAPLNNLFDWTLSGTGQVEIVGELLMDIGNVLGNAEFEITALDNVGNSTFNTTFQLNGATGCNDSETNLNNNIANLQYAVQNPLALTCQPATIFLDAAGEASFDENDLVASFMDMTGTGVFTFDPESPLTCLDAGNTVQVTVTLTDELGNSETCQSMVTVMDNLDPTITCPADVMVNTDPGSCFATSVSLGSPVADDNCSGFMVENDAPASFPIGETIVNWTITDASQHTASCTQKVTVVDNEAPALAGTDDCSTLNSLEQNLCLAEAQAFDATTLELSVASLYQDNCSVVTVEHLSTLEGESNSDCEWLFTYTFTISDEYNNSTTCEVIYSGGDGDAPVLENSEEDCSTLDMTEQTICLSEAETFDPTTLESAVAALYTDNCGSVNVEHSSTTPGSNSDCDWSFTYEFTISDDCNNTTTCQVIYSGGDGEAPQLVNSENDCSSLDLPDQPICLSEASSFDASTLEPDVAILYTDNCGSVTVALTNTTPGETNTDCSWTFTYEFTISDDCENTTTCQVTYSGGDDQAPIPAGELDCSSLDMPGQTICLSSAIAFDPTTLESAVANLYSDNCGTVSAVYDNTTPGSNTECDWSFTYEFIISDACNNSTTCQVVYSGGDSEAPQLVDSEIDCSSLDLPDQNICLAEAASFDATTLESSIAALYTDCGSIQVELTGTIEGEGNSDCDWSFTYQFSINDGCDNSTTCEVTYSGGDSEAPVLLDNEITCSSLNMTDINECLASAGAFDPTTLESSVAALYTDNCSTVTVVYAGSVAGGSNTDASWEFTYEYIVKDDCDNPVSCFVTYSGGDTEAPMVVCQDIEITLDGETGTASITPEQIDNGSTDNCGIASMTLDQTEFSCSSAEEVVVILTVTDHAGNSSTCQANVRVNSSPVCMPVTEDCTPVIYLTAAYLANDPHQLLFKAGMKLLSDGIITSGEDVLFQAGEEVELMPGFEVQQNAILTVNIQDCILMGNTLNKNGN